MYEGTRIDVTRSVVEAAEPITLWLHEESITPGQIGDYKTELHKDFMRNWLKRNSDLVKGRSFEELWRVREECVAALAQ